MPVAAPIVISALSAASSIKSTTDARKGQKEQLAQQERLAAETRANTPQGEANAQDVFSSKRRRRTPGFTDAGAASASQLGGTQGAYLGQ